MRIRPHDGLPRSFIYGFLRSKIDCIWRQTDRRQKSILPICRPFSDSEAPKRALSRHITALSAALEGQSHARKCARDAPDCSKSTGSSISRGQHSRPRSSVSRGHQPRSGSSLRAVCSHTWPPVCALSPYRRWPRRTPGCRLQVLNGARAQKLWQPSRLGDARWSEARGSTVSGRPSLMYLCGLSGVCFPCFGRPPRPC